MLSARMQKGLTTTTFLIIPITSLVLFGVWPVVQLFYISFLDFNGINWLRAEWVGLLNYTDLFTWDLQLLYPITNSFYYLFGSFIQLILATWFAVVLHQKLPGSRLFRTILFIPFVLNSVAAAIIFRNLLDVNGALNDILTFLFGPGAQVQWLDASESYTNFSLAAASVWRYLGFNLVITFGALQSIPQDQYDAARIEGANGWQCFWRITFPSIKLVLLLQIMLSVVGSLEVFEIPILITGGAGNTSTFAIEMVRTGFENQRAGTAAAMAILMLLFVICVVLIVRTLNLSKNRAAGREF